MATATATAATIGLGQEHHDLRDSVRGLAARHAGADVVRERLADDERVRELLPRLLDREEGPPQTLLVLGLGEDAVAQQIVEPETDEDRPVAHPLLGPAIRSSGGAHREIVEGPYQTRPFSR